MREAIRRIGGTLPENLPPAEHIKQVAKRAKKATPKLELDGLDAKGLAGLEHKPSRRDEASSPDDDQL